MPDADDMARFGNVPVSLWSHGSRFRLLSPGGQRLYLYLFTSPDRTVTGVQPLRPGKWAAAAAGLTRADLETELAELAAAGWLIADHDTGEVMIRWYMRETGVITNPKWMKAVPAALEQVESPALRSAILEELAAAGKLAVPDPENEGPQGALFGEFPQPNTLSDGVSDGVSDGGQGALSPSRGRSRDLVPSSFSSSSLTATTSNGSGAGTRSRAGTRASPAGLARFAEFYQAYPRHESKAAAEKSWAKALESGISADHMIAAASRYRDDPNRESRFTKLPSTWLNQGCWDDDPLPDRAGRPPAGSDDDREAWTPG